MGNTLPASPETPRSGKAVRGCCGTGYADMTPTPRLVRTPLDAQEMMHVRDGMLALERKVEILQSNMVRLQHDNCTLQHQNSTLVEKNVALHESLEAKDFLEQWSRFDVVAEHYKRLVDHHGFGEADSAAGACQRTESPRAAEAMTDPKKRVTKDLSVSFDVETKDGVSAVGGKLVAGVAAEGYTEGEIIAITPSSFVDSKGRAVHAATPSELFACEHWPVTLSFNVNVERQLPTRISQQSISNPPAKPVGLTRCLSTPSLPSQTMTYRLDGDTPRPSLTVG